MPRLVETAKPNAKPKPDRAGFPGLPERLRVLYITTSKRPGAWLAEALASDSGSQVLLEEAKGSVAGLARLRDEAFDAILISHVPGELDALELIAGYRAGGAEEPILVLGDQSEQEMAALCYEAGADGYVCIHTTTVRTLIWMVARAVQRHQIFRENRRLCQAERRRLQQEREEAEHLLTQQRKILADLYHLHQLDGPAASAEAACSEAGPSCLPPLDLPAELVQHYRDLLRTYVIMGTGNLAKELSRLAELLILAGVSARALLQLHTQVLEEMLRGLGSRSTRHVITRADLLALEMLLYLAEGYRGRYLHRQHPPVQRMLPGFDRPAPAAF
jgi:DNA-binding NarL/FixJ family response regulator